jgi:hypothetical protein
MMGLKTIAMIALLAMAGGCATIMRGSEQSIDFQTVPPGATVSVDNKTLITPASVSLKRLKTYPVVISKPDYRTIEFKLIPEFDGVSLVGNLIMPGGSAGILVDAASGADRNFYEMAVINLVPATQPSEAPLVLRPYKGHLMNDAQYAIAVEADARDRSQFFRGEP